MDFRSGALVTALALMGAACSAGEAVLPETAPLTVVFSKERPAPPQRYVGTGTCRGCHEKIYRFWKGTPHAAGFATLVEENSEGDPSCLRCHVTGYGERGGFTGGDSSPGLAAVTCEGCHGPGGDHAGSVSPGQVPTAGAGECSTCDVGRVCRFCHTTVMSPDFELAPALGEVSCTAAGED